MMAFSTRYWTSALASGWTLALCLMLAVFVTGTARATEIAAMRLERTPEALLVSAQVRFDLPAVVDDALQKGIPLFFVAEAVLLRDRWYWYDKEVARASRHMRLSYQPLTRRWRLLVSNGPITNAGQALGQTFDTLDEAMGVVRRISGWKIADLQEAESDPRYAVTLRFRLDVSQLPRPFQIGLVGQDDWTIVASRTLRLGAPEAPR